MHKKQTGKKGKSRKRKGKEKKLLCLAPATPRPNCQAGKEINAGKDLMYLGRYALAMLNVYYTTHYNTLQEAYERSALTGCPIWDLNCSARWTESRSH
jgi:hypothetical protein